MRKVEICIVIPRRTENIRNPAEGQVIVPAIVASVGGYHQRAEHVLVVGESTFSMLLLRRFLSFEWLSNLQVSPRMKRLCECYCVLWLAVP